MMLMKLLTPLLLLLSSFSLQVSAAPSCDRKDRCGFRRSTVCRNGVESCAFFLRGGTCGPCPTTPKGPRYLYWVKGDTQDPVGEGNGSIGRINLDNPSETLVLSGLPLITAALAVDSSTGDVFVGMESKVYRFKADLTQGIVIADETAHGLAVDNVNKKLYWTTLGNQIRRSNLDGTEDESISTKNAEFIAIALDLVNERLYAVECQSYEAYVCSINEPSCTPLGLSADCTSCIAVDVPAGKIYTPQPDNFLMRADLDGANAEEFSFGELLTGVAVSPSDKVIYWSERNAIKMKPTDRNAEATNLLTWTDDLAIYSVALSQP
ncbi:hypothetical protein FisN_UnNu063 [Fistulifera solaris]|uniref:Uncharacterized protein n=1 Tax=Fistulifera solaris TaxID=1519565 RepID=A0A1Z5JPZ3_FISSO|nr:hypothetical protein FisN_UnNu063 [Fistulifera solaris]|eukprot:GAX15912.1 hypothetical protein FisN_UnNu063 [Fistulifera solaris]